MWLEPQEINKKKIKKNKKKKEIVKSCNEEVVTTRKVENRTLPLPLPP